METKGIQIDRTNVEQQLAFDLVANTDSCLFITGKAGTGKSFFIKRICEEVNKNFLVLAPTGIAAINVGGQTIHSFFGFPLEIIGPNTTLYVSDEKKEILEHIDTIIIDEASMVRSDLVDGMDMYLRQAFSTNYPFGGKQILFVGDLFQLPPVVKWGSADEEMLIDLYGGGMPFFYKAHVLKRMNLPKIEFRKVYRQTDPEFVSILNKMRVGDVTFNDLKPINKRVRPNEEDADYSVTLTAYNAMADKINACKLEEISGEEFCYKGKITGNFKMKDSPAPENLKLKVGAQVIFCRNDYTHGCVNGTIAKVIELDDDKITVQLERGSKFHVEKVTWESKEQVYNRETRKIEAEVVGTYEQYPLKLAWAITIHKSQSMTFDKMRLDLTRGVFAAGQAYVAISRMSSLEGLTLSNQLLPSHIIQNPEVRAFANSFNDVAMINDELECGKMIHKYLAVKDYDMAAKVCLMQVQDRIRNNDYRNAALIAKKMFDLMLDDEHLLGYTADVDLLKDCSVTCHFLNAVLCVYGNRYEEAIGYADLVLSRRMCFEAMFIKARALYALERYDEAYDVNYMMITASRESEENRSIDKKQYLFEAKLNEKIGNSNGAICKELIDVCPECISAYLMLRDEMLDDGITLEEREDEQNAELITAFNDETVSDAEFKQKLVEADKSSRAFIKLKRRIHKVEL